MYKSNILKLVRTYKRNAKIKSSNRFTCLHSTANGVCKFKTTSFSEMRLHRRKAHQIGRIDESHHRSTDAIQQTAKRAMTSVGEFLTLYKTSNVPLPEYSLEEITEENEMVQLLLKITNNAHLERMISHKSYNVCFILLIKKQFYTKGEHILDIILNHFQEDSFELKIFCDSSYTPGPCPYHTKPVMCESSLVTLYAKQGYVVYANNISFRDQPGHRQNQLAAFQFQMVYKLAAWYRKRLRVTPERTKIQFLNKSLATKGEHPPFGLPDIIKALKISYSEGVPEEIMNSERDAWSEYDLLGRLQNYIESDQHMEPDEEFLPNSDANDEITENLENPEYAIILENTKAKIMAYDTCGIWKMLNLATIVPLSLLNTENHADNHFNVRAFILKTFHSWSGSYNDENIRKELAKNMYVGKKNLNKETLWFLKPDTIEELKRDLTSWASKFSKDITLTMIRPNEFDDLIKGTLRLEPELKKPFTFLFLNPENTPRQQISKSRSFTKLHKNIQTILPAYSMNMSTDDKSMLDEIQQDKETATNECHDVNQETTPTEPEFIPQELIESTKKLTWTDSKIARYNPKSDVYHCADCDQSEIDSRVVNHWLGYHDKTFRLNCTECSYTTTWSHSFNSHLKRIHNIDVNNLDIPDLRLRNEHHQELKGMMKELKESISKSAAKKYKCPFCNYTNRELTPIVQHIWSHRTKPECYICGVSFRQMSALHSHFKKLHPGMSIDNKDPSTTHVKQSSTAGADIADQLIADLPNFKCPVTKCLYATHDSRHFNDHLFTHAKPYECADCIVTVSTSFQLGSHTNKVHGRRLCTTCVFLCDDDVSLQEHKKNCPKKKTKEMREKLDSILQSYYEQMDISPPSRIKQADQKSYQSLVSSETPLSVPQVNAVIKTDKSIKDESIFCLSDKVVTKTESLPISKAKKRSLQSQITSQKPRLTHISPTQLNLKLDKDDLTAVKNQVLTKTGQTASFKTKKQLPLNLTTAKTEHLNRDESDSARAKKRSRKPKSTSKPVGSKRRSDCACDISTDSADDEEDIPCTRISRSSTKKLKIATTVDEKDDLHEVFDENDSEDSECWWK